MRSVLWNGHDTGGSTPTRLFHFEYGRESHLVFGAIMTGHPPGIDLVVIRRIELGDAPALVGFYNGLSESSKRTFRPLGSTTTLDVCEGIIQDNRPETDEKFDLVALYKTRIVGWSFLWKLRSDEPGFGLAIADDHQGKGLGRDLMDRVMKVARERELRKVFLTVVKDNEVAWRMYEKRGFVRYDEYVAEDGLSYLRMAAKLPAERGL